MVITYILIEMNCAYIVQLIFPRLRFFFCRVSISIMRVVFLEYHREISAEIRAESAFPDLPDFYIKGF